MELNDSLTFGVFAPYKDGFKDQIIKDAKTLDVPYQLTWTCYNPKKEVTEFLDNNIEVTATPCLECESCKERESMASLVLTDVNKYSVTYKVEA